MALASSSSPHEPAPLGLVDVAGRGADDGAALGDRVERDEAQARPRVEAVVARRVAGRLVLAGVHLGEPVRVALRAERVDALQLDAVGEAPAGIRRHREALALREGAAGREGRRGIAVEGLEAADDELLVGGVGVEVALDAAVVVSVGDVGRHARAAAAQAVGHERLLGPVHQARVGGPLVEEAGRLVGVVEVAAAVADLVVVVVLDAGVALRLVVRTALQRELVERLALGVVVLALAAVRVDRPAALDQVARPEVLVQLLVVGLVAGDEREVHQRPEAAARAVRAGLREVGQLAHRRVDHERHQRLLRAPRVETGRAVVEQLDARRRLLVRELEVAELGEVGERAPPLAAVHLRLGAGQLAHHACGARAVAEGREAGPGPVEGPERLDRPARCRAAELALGGAGQGGQDHGGEEQCLERAVGHGSGGASRTGRSHRSGEPGFSP